MTDNWRDHMNEFIGAVVMISFGQEQIMTTLTSIEVIVGRGATYTLEGRHHGWQIHATATTLAAPDATSQPPRYIAGGEITLSAQMAPEQNG